MATLGLYFQISQPEANALRARLNKLFGVLGYATEESARGGRERRKPWAGGLPRGLIALDHGEVAIVRLPDSQDNTRAIIKFIRDVVARIAMEQGEHYKEALTSYADSLEQALARDGT